jgi:hypothetical protein
VAKEVSLRIVIGGSTTTLSFEKTERLAKVIEEALAATHNTGRPASEWVATNEAGETLDPRKPLPALGLVDGARVFLSPGAGAGGCA